MTVDKEVLYEFLVSPIPEVNNSHLAELNKLISIVVNKHFKGYQFKCTPTSIVMSDLLIKKHGYDPNRDAYNYLYTMIRNLIGNFLRKDNYLDNRSVDFDTKRSDTSYDVDDIERKETGDFTDDLKQDLTLEEVESFQQLKPYMEYLTCSVPYTIKRVSRGDAMALLLYMEKNLKTRAVEINLSKVEYNAIYRLLKKLF